MNTATTTSQYSLFGPTAIPTPRPVATATPAPSQARLQLMRRIVARRQANCVSCAINPEFDGLGRAWA